MVTMIFFNPFHPVISRIKVQTIFNNGTKPMRQSLPGLDKSKLTVTRLGDTEEEKAYWLSRTPEERLAAIEVSRRMVYGEDAATARMVKVIEVCNVTWR